VVQPWLHNLGNTTLVTQASVPVRNSVRNSMVSFAFG
jgi:hypothetical protein